MSRQRRACPACGADDPASILAIDRVPAHSCVPLRDGDLARAVPVGRIDLVACRACGLVHNAAFDPALVDYTQAYEETQAFSGTFRAFVDELVDELVDRTGGPGHILEIGCGKGEFLARACARTGASGLGVDPAWRADRRPADAPDDVAFLRAELDADSAWTGDVIVCRHTQEHVADVGTFTRWLADAAARTPGSLVLTEVPAAERILTEGAFWDVYHEHVIYPTASVWADVMARAGLAVQDLVHAYDDQYLVCWATVDGTATSVPVAARVDPAQVQAFADAAARAFGRSLDGWRRWFQQTGETHRVVMWGAGSKAVSTLTTLGLGAEVTALTDVNPHKWGTVLPVTAHRVVAPPDLRDLRPEVVVAANPAYLAEIRRDLDALGLAATELTALTPEPPTPGR